MSANDSGCDPGPRLVLRDLSLLCSESTEVVRDTEVLGTFMELECDECRDLDLVKSDETGVPDRLKASTSEWDECLERDLPTLDVGVGG